LESPVTRSILRPAVEPGVDQALTKAISSGLSFSRLPGAWILLPSVNVSLDEFDEQALGAFTGNHNRAVPLPFIKSFKFSKTRFVASGSFAMTIEAVLW